MLWLLARGMCDFFLDRLFVVNAFTSPRGCCLFRRMPCVNSVFVYGFITSCLRILVCELASQEFYNWTRNLDGDAGAICLHFGEIQEKDVEWMWKRWWRDRSWAANEGSCACQITHVRHTT